MISDIRLWRSAQNRYVRLGDPEGLQAIPREEAVTVLGNYIQIEGIFA